MTLIAGFNCFDGFVIAADTEIEHGPTNFQNSKLQNYFSDRYGYTLIVGGAGSVSYFTMASQKIRDAVAKLLSPTLATIRDAIDATISEVHDKYIFNNWKINADERPNFDLIIGVHDGDGGSVLLRSDDVALIEVQSCDFIGSGAYVAQLVAERLITPGLSAAVTFHLASQIFREVKGKGVAVGGNTEIYARRKDDKAEQFFALSAKDYRFIWGLEEALLGAIRDALVKDREQSPERMKFIEDTLRNLRADAEKPRAGGGTEQHFIEFGTEYLNPWKR